MKNDMKDWQAMNERYLSAALHWLRLRLRWLTESLSALESSANEKQKIEKEMNRAYQALITFETGDLPPALVILSRSFGLSRFEQEALLLCAAMELDTRMPGLCAQAQDDANRPFPTFALAMALFDQPAWDVLSPERPLRYWRLIEISHSAFQSLITSPWRADERIVNFIKGLNHLDDRLNPLLVPFDVPVREHELPLSQQEAVAAVVKNVRKSMEIGPVSVIQLVGLDSASKQLVAQQAARILKLTLFRLPVELLPSQPADLDGVARLWQRENFLLPVALYLDAQEPEAAFKSESGMQPAALPLHRFLSRSQGIYFLGTREMRSGFSPFSVSVEVKKPTAAEQQSVWADLLKDQDGAADSSALLAGQFNLNVSTIHQIVKDAGDEPVCNGGNRITHLWESCLVNTGPKMDTLAQKIDVKASWADIVLPQETMALLHQIADQVKQRTKVYDTWGFRKKMNRGLGINALFTGESGTGKTMAAEVIANDLRLNLYRIDLSGVVSKYIGETEKNLRRLFDTAEDGGAILFFDEADALFGKRSEVKDSHDRYANIEINYLLQRMEAYNGLAILATNMKNALDEAFVRRLRFIVNFPFPGLSERKSILQNIFPAKVPKSELDYDRLARLNLSGGAIHNIAVNAAFRAAQTGMPVTMPVLLTAAKAEFRKMEHPIKEADFLWQGSHSAS